MRRQRERGMVLLGTYLLLSVMLLYSGAMTMRTTNERLASERLRARDQSLDLAQAAAEQLREDLFIFLRDTVYQGAATSALNWLDGLDPTRADVAPVLALPAQGASGIFGFVTGNGLVSADGVMDNPPGPGDSPRTVLLPIGGGETLGTGEAWIAQVTPAPPFGLFAPRDVTIESRAVIGSTIVKRIRTTYQISLRASNVFRYAYFVNNYGWFNQLAGVTSINGDMRANGNLRLTGSLGSLYVNGDLYASNNPDLTDPVTHLPATGTITGDPNQRSSWADYWAYKRDSSARARPARRLTAPTQPAIRGSTTNPIPSPLGWDTDSPLPNRPDQRRFTNKPIQEMPYLGDLLDQAGLYRTLATDYNEQAGSTLKIRGGPFRVTIPPGGSSPGAVYHGPDGIEGTADDKQPLVLIGTDSNPIEIDGPVIIPGDVIIAGKITGSGTIYAGRNVHIVGNLAYKKPPTWVSLERDPTTGQIRQANQSTGPLSNLGRVCNDGTYYPPGGDDCD